MLAQMLKDAVVKWVKSEETPPLRMFDMVVPELFIWDHEEQTQKWVKQH